MLSLMMTVSDLGREEERVEINTQWSKLMKVASTNQKTLLGYISSEKIAQVVKPCLPKTTLLTNPFLHTLFS